MITQEEARIEIQSLIDTFEEYEPGGTRAQAALKIALSALRPASGEQVYQKRCQISRMTTDDKKSIMFHLNTFFAKDGEVWVRGGGPYPDYPDVTLVQWIKSAAEKHHLNIEGDDPESLGDEMYDALQDGDETVEGIVALLHAAAVQAAEMRGRLEMIEDILGGKYDTESLRNLVEADRAGRCVVLPVLPSLRPGTSGSEIYILLDSGEIVEDDVNDISIGPNSRGEMNFVFSTFESGDFETADIGKHIFWDVEAARQAASSLTGEPSC